MPATRYKNSPILRAYWPDKDGGVRSQKAIRDRDGNLLSMKDVAAAYVALKYTDVSEPNARQFGPFSDLELLDRIVVTAAGQKRSLPEAFTPWIIAASEEALNPDLYRRESADLPRVDFTPALDLILGKN